MLGQQEGRVALKIVKPESDIDFGPANESGVTYDDVLQAFRDEFKLLEALGKHPNIVGVVGVSDGGRVLVMEQAAHDLFSVVRKMRRKLPLDLAKQWSHDILSGIAYIHDMGIIHQVRARAGDAGRGRGGGVLRERQRCGEGEIESSSLGGLVIWTASATEIAFKYLKRMRTLFGRTPSRVSIYLGSCRWASCRT